MTAAVDSQLLYAIKQELLTSLQSVETNIVDIFDYDDIAGIGDAIQTLHTVHGVLTLLGEKEAASLCGIIKQKINDFDLDTNEDSEDYYANVASAFLILIKHIRDLPATNESYAQLSQVKNILSDKPLVETFRLPVAQKAQLEKSLIHLKQLLSNSSHQKLWQLFYQQAKELKPILRTKENYEFLWLLQRLAIAKVKKPELVNQNNTESWAKKSIAFLEKLHQEGESSDYADEVVTFTNELLQLLKINFGSQRQDYEPPKKSWDDLSSASILFPVAFETLESIAFSVKKELTITKRYVEELYESNIQPDALTGDDTKIIKSSLSLTKASFQLLGFGNGVELINAIYHSLEEKPYLPSFFDDLSDYITLVENALSQLRYRGDYESITSTMSLKNVTSHMLKVTTKSAVAMTAAVAYRYIRQLSEKTISEAFSTLNQEDFMARADEAHQVRCAMLLLQYPSLEDLLMLLEKAYLFLCENTENTGKEDQQYIYLNLLAVYEIALEQLQNNANIEDKVLGLLTEAQQKFLSSIGFDDRQLAVPAYGHQHIMGESSQQLPIAEDALLSKEEKITSSNTEEKPTEEEQSIEPRKNIVEEEQQSANEETIDDEAGIDTGVVLSEQQQKIFNYLINEYVESQASVSSEVEDEEILEIFLDEGADISGTLSEIVPKLQSGQNDNELIGEIRRAFHTFKGSGRMVGLNVFGEFAWQYESFLNQVLDGRLAIDDNARQWLIEGIELAIREISVDPFVENRGTLLHAGGIAYAMSKLDSIDEIPEAIVETTTEAETEPEQTPVDASSESTGIPTASNSTEKPSSEISLEDTQTASLIDDIDDDLMDVVDSLESADLADTEALDLDSNEEASSLTNNDSRVELETEDTKKDVLDIVDENESISSDHSLLSNDDLITDELVSLSFDDKQKAKGLSDDDKEHRFSATSRVLSTENEVSDNVAASIDHSVDTLLSLSENDNLSGESNTFDIRQEKSDINLRIGSASNDQRKSQALSDGDEEKNTEQLPSLSELDDEPTKQQITKKEPTHNDVEQAITANRPENTVSVTSARNDDSTALLIDDEAATRETNLVAQKALTKSSQELSDSVSETLATDDTDKAFLSLNDETTGIKQQARELEPGNSSFLSNLAKSEESRTSTNDDKNDAFSLLDNKPKVDNVSSNRVDQVIRKEETPTLDLADLSQRNFVSSVLDADKINEEIVNNLLANEQESTVFTSQQKGQPIEGVHEVDGSLSLSSMEKSIDIGQVFSKLAQHDALNDSQSLQTSEVSIEKKEKNSTPYSAIKANSEEEKETLKAVSFADYTANVTQKASDARPDDVVDSEGFLEELSFSFDDEMSISNDVALETKQQSSINDNVVTNKQAVNSNQENIEETDESITDANQPIAAMPSARKMVSDDRTAARSASIEKEKQNDKQISDIDHMLDELSAQIDKGGLQQHVDVNQQVADSAVLSSVDNNVSSSGFSSLATSKIRRSEGSHNQEKIHSSIAEVEPELVNSDAIQLDVNDTNVNELRMSAGSKIEKITDQPIAAFSSDSGLSSATQVTNLRNIDNTSQDDVFFRDKLERSDNSSEQNILRNQTEIGGLDDRIISKLTQLKSDVVDALKVKRNGLQSKALYEKVINRIYEIEALLDEKSVPSWVWELLASFEAVIEEFSDQTNELEEEDREEIQSVVGKLANLEPENKQLSKNLTNDLMNLRAVIIARNNHQDQKVNLTISDQLVSSQGASVPNIIPMSADEQPSLEVSGLKRSVVEAKPSNGAEVGFSSSSDQVQIIPNIDVSLAKKVSQMAPMDLSHLIRNDGQLASIEAAYDLFTGKEDAKKAAELPAVNRLSDKSIKTIITGLQAKATNDRADDLAMEGVAYTDPEESDPDILDIFLDEAKDIIKSNGESLNAWGSDFTNLSAIQEIQRGMHTLKGGAKMAQFMVLCDLAHNVETLLDLIANGRIDKKQEAAQIIGGGLVSMGNMVQIASKNQRIYDDVEYFKNLDHFVQSESGKALTQSTLPEEKVKAAIDSEKDSAVSPQKDRKQARTVLRVRAETIESMSQLAGDDLIARTRIERSMVRHDFQLLELSRAVGRISEQLRRMESEAESQILSQHQAISIEEGLDESFDPLELDQFSELQLLSRLLSESMDDLQNIHSSLQLSVQDIKHLLAEQKQIQGALQDTVLSATLVRFDSVQVRLEQLIEQVTKDIDKEVKLTLIGGDVEIERDVLAEIVTGFEHAIRNTIAHGIEPVNEREKQGKSRHGNITILVRREEKETLFSIVDDGRGANFDAIRKKTEDLGLLSGAQLDDKGALLQMLFEPGFSTAGKIDQTAGRGIGLDVLRDLVYARQGSILIESEDTKGLGIEIRIPFTILVSDALVAEIGSYTYAIPMASVEGVVRVPVESYQQFVDDNEAYYVYGNNRYKIENLSQFIDPNSNLQISQSGAETLLVNVDHQYIAFMIDHVSKRQELIVKPVSDTFTTIPGIIGAAILDSGSPVPVLDAALLGRHFLAHHKDQFIVESQTDKPEEIEPESKALKVLVVDDSITMRKMTTKILKNYHCEIKTAKDGLDAVDVLVDWTPELILLDIEMPRMDGFEFAAHVRNRPGINDIPIIMITSRMADKHREHAMELKVNDYLGKPYKKETLLKTMEKVLDIDMSTLAS